MTALQSFLQNFDERALLLFLFSIAAALFSLTVHELSHGAAAYALGDPTAKEKGRLTLNPIKHIDPLGLILMLTAHVGWAKPVPVDMRNFKHPKRGMALTALAGPASNFLLAWVFLLLTNLFCLSFNFPFCDTAQQSYTIFICFNAAILNIGLGLFNLFPIPPMDGSKILFSFLPDRVYYTILRYERYIMLLLWVIVWFGVLNTPLSYLMFWALRGLCVVSGLPFETALILLSIT